MSDSTFTSLCNVCETILDEKQRKTDFTNHWISGKGFYLEVRVCGDVDPQIFLDFIKHFENQGIIVDDFDTKTDVCDILIRNGIVSRNNSNQIFEGVRRYILYVCKKTFARTAGFKNARQRYNELKEYKKMCVQIVMHSCINRDGLFGILSKDLSTHFCKNYL